MKKKPTLIILAICVTGLIAFSTLSVVTPATSESMLEKFSSDFDKRNMSVVEKKLAAQPAVPDPSVTDEVAFGILLRFISGNRNPAEKVAIRKYIVNNLGLFRSEDQNVLFEVAEYYKLQSNRIQMQSETITQRYHPTHNTITQQDSVALTRLGEEKKQLIRNSVERLRQAVSIEGWLKIETAVRHRIKPGIKTHRMDRN